MVDTIFKVFHMYRGEDIHILFIVMRMGINDIVQNSGEERLKDEEFCGSNAEKMSVIIRT